MTEAMSGKRFFQGAPAENEPRGRPPLFQGAVGATDRSAHDSHVDANMLATVRSAGTHAWHLCPQPAVAILGTLPPKHSSCPFCDQVGGQNRGGPRRFIPRQQHCARKPAPRGSAYEVKYTTPTWADEDRVIEFLRRTFFRYEPTMVATGLSGRVPDSMLRMYRDTLREGMSIMAVNAQCPDEILGVAVNGCVRKEDSDELRDVQAECSDTRKIYDFWAYLLEKNEGWPDDVTTVMELKAISTDPKAFRTGLAVNLAELSRRLAKETFGFSAFRCDCTGLYSAKMADKIRLPRAFSFRYKDYLDMKGKPVFRIPAPHTEVIVYVDNFTGPQSIQTN